MRRYLFFINQLYSYAILRPLQEAIWTRGDDVAWFLNGVDGKYLRENEKQLHTVKQVKEYNPLAVYVPGNWVPDFFPGVKVEVFHGLANDQTGKKGHFKIRELFDLYCTHAPEVTQQFETLAKKHGTFSVYETGWPKLDPLFNESICKEDQHNVAIDNIASDKPVVLFASTFSPSLTQAPYLFETIKKLTLSAKWHWVITLHPKTPIETVNKYKALAGEYCTYIDSSFSVIPLMKRANVMVCDTSSIALEFMMLDKPLVTFRTKAPGPHVLDVTDVDELERVIEHALERPEKLVQSARDYVDRLHAYRDGKSSQRILQATDDFLANSIKDKLKRKPPNLWRKIQMRNRMKYYRF